MHLWKFAIVCPALALASLHASACYTVFDKSDRVVYQSHKPPVDMSRPLHETVPVRFPGGHLIFDSSAECPVISSVASGMGGRDVTGNSPLLTDQQTARSLHLPHRDVGHGAVVVRPRDAAISTGVSVVPGSTAPTAARRARAAQPARP